MAEFGSDRMWGLKELPLPEAVSWLPATPGWLVAGAILLLILAWFAWLRWRSWQRDRYRREALSRIDAIGRGTEALAGLPLVLRATALAAFPRDEVAGLHGAIWVEWLNQNGGCFEPADAECLDLLPYDPNAVRELSASTASRLVAASRAWVKGHHARI
ncbi:MAG: DUF4381 domain-containing protein [bacterium]|nr:DUF4381 domain-containing protein [bacterium]